MKLAVVLLCVAVAAAQEAAVPAAAPVPIVAILRNVQVNPDALGAHSSDFEAANGITHQFSGKEGLTGGSNMAGTFSYPLADGLIATFSYVADDKGYQVQSDMLPVAPAFPHPIPQFVQDQIAFAEAERARLAAE